MTKRAEPVTKVEMLLLREQLAFVDDQIARAKRAKQRALDGVAEVLPDHGEGDRDKLRALIIEPLDELLASLKRWRDEMIEPWDRTPQ